MSQTELYLLWTFFIVYLLALTLVACYAFYKGWKKLAWASLFIVLVGAGIILVMVLGH